uniref:Solute carrier family 45 member 4 n=1 Tax=Equus caballus TaxID=9796 RepID=A0A9L0S1P6_HORSE
MKMAPQNADSESMQGQESPVPLPALQRHGSSAEARDETGSEGSIDRVPVRLWVMHGAVMFGREFCYAMETALVTPILLQIGLPEQYYSLTWFLSPILGLIFTPLIGSASDRCTLSWGRRRPFILALCVGVLFGVALFLNGSAIGLALGDVPSRQPIGIILTVLGVVVLDFSADATEGPIRAYLLDVVDSEEQDMALNIHAFSAGLGGAVGYVLGGLDWTQTFLSTWFRTQNQVLFFFAAIIFTVSVALHLFSIEEEQYSPQQERSVEAADALPPAARLSVPDGGATMFPDEVQSEHELALDYLDVDMVRSKSDSVLHVPDAALDLEPELLFLHDIEPSIFHDASYPNTPRSTSQELVKAKLPCLSPLLREPANEDETLLDNRSNEAKVPNGSGSPLKDGLSGYTRVDIKPSATSSSMRRRRHMFRRQASSTFSYYGKIGAHRYRYRRANAVVLIKPSRSMSDLYDLQKRQRQRCRHRNQSGATNSSGDTESEEGDGETTVRLLWLSMLKMPRELMRLCLCHLLTWFSVIAEAVFYTDFMGQVIFEGDPKLLLLSTERSPLWRNRPSVTELEIASFAQRVWHLVPAPLNPSLVSGTGPLQLNGLAGLQRRREDGLLGPGHLRGDRRHLLSPATEVFGQLRPEHQGHLCAGDAGLLHRHGRDGHVRQCLRRHDHDQHHGHRLHEHLLLPLRPAWAVPRQQGVRAPQPRELQARLRHRLCHPLLPGLHLPDPGGVCPGGRGRRCWDCARHPHGGLCGLFPGLPDSHVPGDLPRGVGRSQGRAAGPAMPALG